MGDGEAPRYVCAECGHTRAEHSLSLEDCGALVLIGGIEGLEGFCACRGWHGVEVTVSAEPRVGAIAVGHDLGGESGGA